jgi:hypothetical protein
MFETGLWVLLLLQVFTFRLALVREMFAAQVVARPSSQPPTMELRVDVQWGSAEMNEELASLHARLDRSGLLMNGTQIIKTWFAHVVFRHREADGEHCIHLMDEAQGRPEGYTTFRRLIEVIGAKQPATTHTGNWSSSAITSAIHFRRSAPISRAEAQLDANCVMNTR